MADENGATSYAIMMLANLHFTLPERSNANIVQHLLAHLTILCFALLLLNLLGLLLLLGRWQPACKA